MKPPLEVEFVSGTSEGTLGALKASLVIHNNTDVAHEVSYVVQVLDVAGKDITQPLVVPDQKVAENAASSAEMVTIPALPDGYHRVNATALAKAGDLSGGGEAYLRVQDGKGAFVTYSEWYFNSGAESFGGPI